MLPELVVFPPVRHLGAFYEPGRGLRHRPVLDHALAEKGMVFGDEDT
jgi:hypothetical protein